ncbi:hypothetical protein EGK74_10225 [Neisseria weixii]|uniref:Uncharacterized protein n=1 Tax=Neisseria weixii TaxID=1853276 RepID=A0A3N4MMA5_9NEIS|nr:hypothetical protein EGK74_10225 [Neisseria weixii]
MPVHIIFILFLIYSGFELIISYIYIYNNDVGIFVVMNFLILLSLFGFLKLNKERNEKNKRIVETFLMASIGVLTSTTLIKLPDISDLGVIVIFQFIPLSIFLFLVKKYI